MEKDVQGDNQDDKNPCEDCQKLFFSPKFKESLKKEIRREILEEILDDMLGGMAFSDKEILRAYENGRIIIDPFDRDNVKTSSVDVTLGEWHFRERKVNNGFGIYNPYDSEHVEQVWGRPQKAVQVGEWRKRNGGFLLKNISDNDYVIFVEPGETILAHTQEFIGGADGIITTMMKARSSMGRNFTEVCKCAGWGDVGYFNRWTMEITNNSRGVTIPLVVGRCIAQIIFLPTSGVSEGRSYSKEGKYQASSSLAEIKKEWSPYMMIPKLFKDYESSIS